MTGPFLSSSANPELDSSAKVTPATSLPLNMRLGEFELTGVLGEGGFSFVYTALDHSLGRTVAIKEYMPGAIATRLSNGSVVPKALKHEETFKAGLASFINEARLLARFTHPALAHIHRVWEQNGTAYMAMQYCVGETLRQISQSEPAIVKNEKWLKALFSPILDALELLHAQNCFHRDISPDNILVLQNGRPVLLDFGAARQIMMGDINQGVTVILRPGFAPIEQYADDSDLQQGPWTDVYGVGAILYYLLVGKPPVASVARMVKDPMVKLVDSAELAEISSAFRDGIDRALAVHPDQRIQSIAELREALQLPTFRPDEQTEKSLGTPIETHPVANGEAPPLEDTGDTADAELDNDAQAYSSSAEVDPNFFSYPSLNLNPNVAQEASKSNAVMGIKTFLGSLGLGHAALGIGLVVAVLAIFFILLDKPATDSNENSHITANQVQGPVENAPKPAAASVKPSTPSPTDKQAGTAGHREGAPESPVAATSDTPPEEKPSIHKTDAPPVKKETEKPPSLRDTAAETKKAKADTTTAPSADTWPPVESVFFDKPTKAETTKPKTKRSLGAQETEKPPSLRDTATAAKKAKAETTTTPSADTWPPVESVFFDKPTKAETAKPKAKRSPDTRSAPKPITATPSDSPSKAPSVRLFIKPWGQVTVDGQSQGVSPPLTHLTLTPGEHVVSITNGNFPPATIRITVPEKGEIVVSHRFGTK
jgi:serine/threonine protein kinase